jgi:hypothetical protein
MNINCTGTLVVLVSAGKTKGMYPWALRKLVLVVTSEL